MSYSTKTYGGFQLLVRDGQTHELITELPVLDRRTVVLAHPQDHSVVLGSMQPINEEHRLRCAAAGFGLDRRRSGGGAVVIDPFESIWIDFFVPATDPLFDRDVRVGSYWVGDVWARALTMLGRLDSTGDVVAVHRGGMVATTWSKQCCFAGLGPGEVTYGQRKVVGLSQRRERVGAWFFCLAYRSFDPVRDARLLAPHALDMPAIADDLETHVGAVDRPLAEVESAVLDSLTEVNSQS